MPARLSSPPAVHRALQWSTGSGNLRREYDGGTKVFARRLARCSVKRAIYSGRQSAAHQRRMRVPTGPNDSLLYLSLPIFPRPTILRILQHRKTAELKAGSCPPQTQQAQIRLHVGKAKTAELKAELAHRAGGARQPIDIIWTLHKNSGE